ncbi:D-alanyl-D-alanine carboxypeptidase/D-alanyl-D-alanine endopeptidase, partial [Hyalangium sp.]|uniref:D-alanyl-D-alanine carboxypeptidase/D-alanyl-D-alanine endopeptidase n=1 Tax=Hyalangium sp. TaxID=2028555 RepID=UPI002D31B5BF
MQVHRARVVLAATVAIILSLPAAHAAPADKKAEREALKTALLDVLQRTPLKASRVGIFIQSMDDGTVVFSQNPDDLLNPASNVKLVTAAAALATLGPEYRFDTEFLVDPEMPPDGKVKTLYVRGKGDPSMTTERLYGVVAELFHTGLREVQEIIIDDSWFDAERTPPGYDQETSDRAYMSPTGAVSLNWNATAIYLRPGEVPGAKGTVELEPNSDFFVVENGLLTGSRRARRISVASKAFGDKQRIIVKGQVSPDQGALSVWKKIDNPPMYFGFTLKDMLKARGIKVKGRVKLGLAPSRAKLVHVAQSDTFDVILKRLNKLSNNFVAEMLLK